VSNDTSDFVCSCNSSLRLGEGSENRVACPQQTPWQCSKHHWIVTTFEFRKTPSFVNDLSTPSYFWAVIIVH
jgi:hypothetical protein